MTSKVALVVGASRGIGRCVSVSLARNGYKVAAAAKTLVEKEGAPPGSVTGVKEEIECLGQECMPVRCDVRNDGDVEAMVSSTVDKFGRIDYVVYNAGAILWNKVEETPLKRFDLMHDVNARGCYNVVQTVLPHFRQQGFGRFLVVCPPIYSRFFKGKTPYAMTKVGMSVLVSGLATELQGTDFSITGLWPATGIESFVTTKLGAPRNLLRTADIFADACVSLAEDPNMSDTNGALLIDEDYLRSRGVNDFSKYRCDPESEPPRMMPKNFPSLLVDEERGKGVFDANLQSQGHSKL